MGTPQKTGWNYTESDISMRYGFVVHNEALADLEAIKSTDPNAWADLAVFLEEIKGDADLISRLNERGYADDYINVDYFAEMQRGKFNIWRLKAGWIETPWEQYRIIYAFDHGKRVFYVLCILKRGEDTYGRTTQNKIERIYIDLGLPRIPF